MTEEHSLGLENRLTSLEKDVETLGESLGKVEDKVEIMKTERAKFIYGAAALFASVLWQNRQSLGF